MVNDQVNELYVALNKNHKHNGDENGEQHAQTNTTMHTPYTYVGTITIASHAWRQFAGGRLMVEERLMSVAKLPGETQNEPPSPLRLHRKCLESDHFVLGQENYPLIWSNCSLLIVIEPH